MLKRSATSIDDWIRSGGQLEDYPLENGRRLGECSTSDLELEEHLSHQKVAEHYGSLHLALGIVRRRAAEEDMEPIEVA